MPFGPCQVRRLCDDVPATPERSLAGRYFREGAAQGTHRPSGFDSSRGGSGRREATGVSGRRRSLPPARSARARLEHVLVALPRLLPDGHAFSPHRSHPRRQSFRRNAASVRNVRPMVQLEVRTTRSSLCTQVRIDAHRPRVAFTRSAPLRCTQSCSSRPLCAAGRLAVGKLPCTLWPGAVPRFSRRRRPGSRGRCNANAAGCVSRARRIGNHGRVFNRKGLTPAVWDCASGIRHLSVERR